MDELYMHVINNVSEVIDSMYFNIEINIAKRRYMVRMPAPKSYESQVRAVVTPNNFYLYKFLSV